MKDKALKKTSKSLATYICITLVLLSILTLTGCKQESVSKNLSDDQATLISVFGYPDQFISVFVTDKSRIETWFYKDMQYAFSFIDGVYAGRQSFMLLEHKEDKYKINPAQFSYGMSPDDIGKIMGDKSIEIIEPDSGYSTLIYADGAIAFTFDTEDNLVCVFRQKALTSGK